MLNDIAQDPNAKLFQIVDKEAVINMINTQGRSFTKPWFGQLMTGPQVIAYLIQLETWLNEYNVKPVSYTHLYFYKVIDITYIHRLSTNFS